VLSEIVVAGFPKCGTTALMEKLDTDPEISVLRSDSGLLEVAWPQIKLMPKDLGESRVIAHKYVSYIFNKEALAYLAASNPDSTIVLCVRDPVKALFSWWTMHRSIARSGKNPTHFAYLDRDFYANCSIDEYFERFAKKRLRYHLYFRRLLAAVSAERVIVVSQERMAQDIQSVAGYVKAVAVSDANASSKPVKIGPAYKSATDGIDVPLDPTTRKHLKSVWRRLLREIGSSGAKSCLLANQRFVEKPAGVNKIKRPKQPKRAEAKRG